MCNSECKDERSSSPFFVIIGSLLEVLIYASISSFNSNKTHFFGSGARLLIINDLLI